MQKLSSEESKTAAPAIAVLLQKFLSCDIIHKKI